MFGGLQIKDATASKDADNELDPTPEPSVPAAPALGLSSFGFMNAGPPEPAPATPAPAVSSFSFLNVVPPEPASVAPPSSAVAGGPAPATSGFSFMMQGSTTSSTDPTAKSPTPPFAAAPPSVPSSGFDFMNSMAATPAASGDATPSAIVEETIIPTISNEVPTVPSPAAASGFSFLSQNPPIAALDESSTSAQRDTNVVSSASSALGAPSGAPNPAPTKTGGLIAGAGVTFGTSSAKPRIKKKKSRASKIGIGASHNDTLPSVPTPVPAPAASVSQDENESARDAALKAANRAEEFMQAKAMQEAKPSTETTATATAAVKMELAADLGLNPSESSDEVLAAAQEAVEKAKLLQHQQKGKGAGFMGTFFKGFRSGPNTTGLTTSSGPMVNSSKHSVGSHSVGSNSSGNAMDRLAKEQQAMKEAMAKRQLEQLQSQQIPTSQSEDEEDDKVIVTTTEGDYKPAAAENYEYTSVTVDVMNNTTPSDSSAYVPAAIPPSSTQKSAFGFQVPVYGFIKKSVVTPVAPNVKKNNTPKQTFKHHQEYFSESVDRAMKKVEDTRNLKKGLLEERFVALAKERFATREIEQIEELQQAAIDEEDYEQADELGQKLDAYNREKSEVANMLANNKIALEKLESENSSLGVLVLSCFEDLALRLDDLKKKELASEKKDDNEIFTQYASISKQLSAEHGRLQQDLKRLERDEQLVGEEKKELEGSIKDQTGEIETLKDEASSKLTEVEKEIEELRNELQRKQKEAADLRTKTFGFEDSISKVRVKFSRQLTRVDKKEISLKESRREWEIENKQHKRQKDAHDLQVKTHSDTLLAHEELMEILESELQQSKEFSQIIPTQLGFMEEKNEAEEKDGDDEGSLAQLQANVVKSEGAIGVSKKALKMASIRIQNLENELDTLVARIPELEKQKKVAAAGRDFKAAGKFSKEIKDANIRIKECEDELNNDAKSKRVSAEEILHQLDSELLEAKKVAHAKEKLSGEKRMEILGNKIVQLVKQKKEECGESKSEGKSVKSVAARVLEGQIMILKAEGSEIGRKYGGWDELMRSINLDDGESTRIIETLSQDSDDAAVSSVVLEDDEENPDDRFTRKERLVKAKELIAKCSEIEAKIKEAADREDFEAAGELQETLDKINVEIEELKITDEECELLAQIDTAVDIVTPEEQQEQCELTSEERLAKTKELTTKQSELEKKIDEAVEKEDYESAQELQTTLDQVTAELTKFNITDEEKELQTADTVSSDAISPVEEPNELISVTEEEEKKDGKDENPTDMVDEKLENGEDETTDLVDKKFENGEDENPIDLVDKKLENGEDEKPTDLVDKKFENGEDENPIDLVDKKLESGEETLDVENEDDGAIAEDG